MGKIVEAFGSSTFFYFFIVVAIFAIGDYLGIITKARLSSVFVALTLFFIGFLTGVLPGDIIARAGLAEFAQVATPLLIFHLGSMINLRQLVEEWRTVVTAALSLVVVALAVLALIPLIGRENALVSIPVLNGGLIATQIMSTAATEADYSVAAGLAAALYALQKFAGSYPASFFGMREANDILKKYRASHLQSATSSKEKHAEPEKVTFYLKHNKFFTDFISIAIAVFFATIASVLGQLTPINVSIWALLFGATTSFFGVIPPRILERGKASGLLSMLVFTSLIPSLANIKLADLASLGTQIVLILSVSLITLFLVFYVLPGWKVTKSRNLAMGISFGQLLGFPATFLIANEVAKAVSDDEREQQVVLDVLLPAYVVSGIVTVTVLSIIIAGIVANLL